MPFKFSTKKSSDFIKQLIRKEFDNPDNNYFSCQKIIKHAEKLGLNDLAEEMRCDVQQVQLFTNHNQTTNVNTTANN